VVRFSTGVDTVNRFENLGGVTADQGKKYSAKTRDLASPRPQGLRSTLLILQQPLSLFHVPSNRFSVRLGGRLRRGGIHEASIIHHAADTSAISSFVRHWCASCAPVRPEITGLSRTENRLTKRNRNGHAARSR